MEFPIESAGQYGFKEGEPPCPGAYRKEGVEKWFIQINTLEEFVSLAETLRYDLIIRTSRVRETEPCKVTGILIYDTYIE
jgi:hypothetical protein